MSLITGSPRPVLPTQAAPTARPVPSPTARTTTATAAAQPGRAWGTAAAVLAESRPCVQSVVALRLLCTTDVLVQPSVRRVVVLVGWLLLSIAVYLLNGLTDIDADRSNGSSRPIASGRLGVATAAAWCLALTGGGLAAAGFAGLVTTALAVAYLGLGWAYSAGPCLKNHQYGSVLAIGGGAALTYLAGLAAADRVDWRDVALVLLLSVWIGVGSMSKDFSDIGGDALAGRRSAPVLYGTRRAAARLAGRTLATSAAVAGLTATAHPGAASAPGPVLVAGSVLLAAAARRFGSDRQRTRRRMPYRVFLFTQYLANAALLIGLAG